MLACRLTGQRQFAIHSPNLPKRVKFAGIIAAKGDLAGWPLNLDLIAVLFGLIGASAQAQEQKAGP